MQLATHLKRFAQVSVLALAAAGVSQVALAGPEDNSVIMSLGGDIIHADPANGTAGSDFPVLYSLYDRLFDFNPEDMTLRPMLATDWSWSEDKMTLIIELREGVKFHDGTDFNAEAVKTSLDFFKSSGVNLDLDPVESIEVLGPYTVALHSTEVNSSLPGLLAERAGMILSPANIEKYGAEEYTNHPVGTGPFMWENRVVGESITLVRFPDYWNPDSVHLDKIEYRIITNPTSAVSALMTGQVDFLPSVDPVNIPALEANPNTRAAIEPTIGFGIININAGAEPLDNQLVRQAWNMSVDRDALARAVYGSVPTEGTALPVPRGYWPDTPELQESYAYNPERAKELLAEAGYPDGITIPLCINANEGMPQPALKVTDILIEQASASGITLDITQQASSGACIQMFAIDQVLPAALLGWSGRPDPAITYNQILSSASYYNTSRVEYGNADELLAELKATFGQEAQEDVYDRLNQVYLDWVPMISLYNWVNVVGYKTGLGGEDPNLLGRPYVRILKWEDN